MGILFTSEVYQWGIIFTKKSGSGDGRVVAEQRGPEFDSRPGHLDFRDWLSPAFKSRYG